MSLADTVAKPQVIREGDGEYQVAVTMLAYREAEAAVTEAKAAVDVEKATAHAIASNKQRAQVKHREILNVAMRAASSPEGIEGSLDDLTAVQTAIALYDRAEQYHRAFPLGEAVATYLSAVVVFREAALNAEKVRRAAREAEIMEDLARVRTQGAPLKLDVADLLASYDQAVLRRQDELQDARTELVRAKEQMLEQQKAFNDRYEGKYEAD